MNIGFSATSPIGRKSCGTWTGTFGAAGRKDTKVDNTGWESVYPSGAACAASRTARLPPAPGWLVTKTCCFQTWVSPSATMRNATSGVLPADESVMICTGLFGYGAVCALASATLATASNHASM